MIAAVLARLLLEGLSALAERLLGQPALGLGDAKLAALGGAWPVSYTHLTLPTILLV